jgi:hypothetical protein
MPIEDVMGPVVHAGLVGSQIGAALRSQALAEQEQQQHERQANFIAEKMLQDDPHFRPATPNDSAEAATGHTVGPMGDLQPSDIQKRMLFSPSGKKYVRKSDAEMAVEQDHASQLETTRRLLSAITERQGMLDQFGQDVPVPGQPGKTTRVMPSEVSGVGSGLAAPNLHHVTTQPDSGGNIFDLGLDPATGKEVSRTPLGKKSTEITEAQQMIQARFRERQQDRADAREAAAQGKREAFVNAQGALHDNLQRLEQEQHSIATARGAAMVEADTNPNTLFKPNGKLDPDNTTTIVDPKSGKEVPYNELVKASFRNQIADAKKQAAALAERQRVIRKKNQLGEYAPGASDDAASAAGAAAPGGGAGAAAAPAAVLPAPATAPPKVAAGAAGRKVATLAKVQAFAKAHGQTLAQAKAIAKQQGWTIQGE